MDLLQNNMPHDNDQYYVYHDQESNTFSVELDEDADEIRDLVERARVIDARLKIEYMTAKERKNLKTQKKKLLKFLEEYYGLIYIKHFKKTAKVYFLVAKRLKILT